MTCNSCSTKVTRALTVVNGVSSAEVNLEKKLAVVKGSATAATLVSAIEGAGFMARGCACNCGPDCACVAGECGCATGACACDPAKCGKSKRAASYSNVHLALAATSGLVVGIFLAKKVL